MSQSLDRYSGDQLDEMTRDRDVRVTAFTIQETGSVSGTGANSMALVTISNEITRAADDTLVYQDQIRSRSGVVRFFVGGDQEAASGLMQSAEVYDEQVRQLQQILASPDLNPALRPVITDEIQVLEQERDRIHSLSMNESRDRGILGGIFG